MVDPVILCAIVSQVVGHLKQLGHIVSGLRYVEVTEMLRGHLCEQRLSTISKLPSSGDVQAAQVKQICRLLWGEVHAVLHAAASVPRPCM